MKIKRDRFSHGWRGGLCLLMFAALLPVHAQEAQVPPPPDWEQSRAEVAALRERVRRIRGGAAAVYDKASDKCREKTFSASACIEKARNRRAAAEREAAVLEKRALEMRKANKKATQEAKRANQRERERLQAGARDRQAVKAQIRREKLQLELDKLRGGQGNAAGN
jgi:hypothetical protein